ncbi:HesA/MoeB/ThiF family protein [Crenobacter intestini]|uniref:Molybdopterin-synthase adenylyltransferase MoeB n=1 Tax=Crenobacter intestini TaxID=2563443 RepID=A0A4T0V725_9NEIS|nr:molybdopterin-synthase adenylyltransferase MoeB [Crenobacter intestini]TIC87187.1 molybdopterin-synthase adenylyltransferase MoeB [Crenobacter intestini]
MNDDQLLRYSRHLLLKEVDLAGQERLARARVLVVGCGGLGAAAVPYLAAAGVGELWLADDDAVELSNLQRQVAYGEADLGRPKVDAARDAVRRIDPAVKLRTFAERLDEARLVALAREVDVLLDCSDNYPTRQALNRAALAARRPVVVGAAVRFDGQLLVVDPRRAGTPCYHCLFGGSEASDGACATFGVFSPLVGVIGAQQALEALKLIIGIGDAPIGRLISYDALSGAWRELGFGRDPECASCAPYARMDQP